MSTPDTKLKLPLVIEFVQRQLSYDWFGPLDFSWFESSGGLSTVPYFQAISEEINHILQTSSRQQPLTLNFGPHDCTTVDGSRNCTEACSDPAYIFTPTNLRICTALSSTALLVQNGSNDVISRDIETFKSIGNLSIPDLVTFNATGVFSHVTRCIPESCVAERLGNCSGDVRDLAGINIDVNNLERLSSVLGQYCNGMDLQINTDIAGPGVLLSYFFQILLAASFYLLFKASTTKWPRRIGFCLHRKHDPASQKRNSLWRSRLSGAVTSSLAEFQEMQLYFVASVQVATLISYNPEISDSASANNSSYTGALINSGTAALLNIAPIASILIVQCSLQRASIRWWYTFLLLTITCILAVFIFAERSILMPPADALFAKFKQEGKLTLCGNNPSPMTYCRPPRETKYLDTNTAGYITVGLIIIAWVGLLIDQLAFNTPDMLWVRVLSGRLNTLFRRGLFRNKPGKLWNSLLAVYWFVIELLLLLMASYQVSVLITISRDVGFRDATNWSFGQLITVTVWAPTVAKFIYFNIFGVKRGFTERIAKTFTITEEDEGNEQVSRPGR